MGYGDKLQELGATTRAYGSPLVSRVQPAV